MKAVSKHPRAVIAALVLLGIVSAIAVSLKIEADRKNKILPALRGLSYSAEQWFSDVEAGDPAEYARHYADFLKSLGRTEHIIWENGGFGDALPDQALRFLDCVCYLDTLFCSHTLTDSYGDSTEFELIKRYFAICNHSITRADSFRQFVERLSNDEDIKIWLDDYKICRNVQGEMSDK